MSKKNPGSVVVQVIDQAVPDAAPAARASSFLAAPIIGGLCCLGLILFLIAAAIVLSLIPVYTQRRNLTVARRSNTVNLRLVVRNPSILAAGTFGGRQRTLLQTNLQAQLNSDVRTRNSIITVNTANGIANGRRKRQALVTTGVVQVNALVNFALSFNIQRDILTVLNSFIINDNLATQLNNVRPTTATGRRRRRSLARRSIEDGGAPSRIVYVDSHQIAASKGNVKSVSFYVDRTCALATIEFGAFDLLDGNVEKNTAQLVLTHRSGEFKLGAAAELKPYMSMITIQLCDGKTVGEINGKVCKGQQFSVLPNQYIGVRSDTCRLGFSRTPTNSVLATTWKLADNSDPFIEPYQKLNYIPSDYTILQSVIIEPTETKNNPLVNTQKSATKKAPRVLFLGAFPPRRYGLAKFLEDLTDNYPGPHSVIAVDEQGVDSLNRNYSDKVVRRLNQTDRDAYFAIADIVNSEAYDVLNVQHEYALYGGMAGEYIVSLLAAVRKPVITTFHTIISKPNTFYLSVTRAICATSTRVIVLAEHDRRLLIGVYGIDETKILVLPNGVPDVAYAHSLSDAKTKLGIGSDVPTVTTCGLLHRNKNIQLALQAMKTVVKTVPNVMYLIVGQTHPSVQMSEGESYRRELEGNVTAFGLSNNVRFINKYVDDNELLGYFGATDIYLTPYAAEDQYVSGTLSLAVGLGKAVVSTPYLYAKELLADGRGFLVPFEDHQFLGSTITRLLEDDDLRDGARRHAYKFGRHMTWPHVAKELEGYFRELLLFT